MTAAVLSVTGCARAIDGSTQDITIETPGADGSNCYIENQEFRYRTFAPQTIKITRSFYPLNVRCLAPGNREKTVVVQPEIQSSTYWNALNGFIPGMMMDYNSRAFYKFPPVVVVDFTDMKPQPMPVPHYDKVFKENPELRGWEEWRPGRAAIESDLRDAPQSLTPRAMPGAEGADAEVLAPPLTPPPPALAEPMGAPRGSSAEELNRTMNPGISSSSNSQPAGAAPMPLLREGDWVK